MNDTSSHYSTKLHETKSQAIGGYSYTIGVCLGVLITVMIMTYVSYLFKRFTRLNASRASLDATISNDDSTNQDGLAKDILSSFPKFTYVQLEPCKSDTTAFGCCICLADYKETDLLRLLPDCGHIFHLKCVDPWLIVHATCPICRNSPLLASTHLTPTVHIDVNE